LFEISSRTNRYNKLGESVDKAKQIHSPSLRVDQCEALSVLPFYGGHHARAELHRKFSMVFYAVGDLHHLHRKEAVRAVLCSLSYVHCGLSLLSKLWNLAFHQAVTLASTTSEGWFQHKVLPEPCFPIFRWGYTFLGIAGQKISEEPFRSGKTVTENRGRACDTLSGLRFFSGLPSKFEAHAVFQQIRLGRLPPLRSCVSAGVRKTRLLGAPCVHAVQTRIEQEGFLGHSQGQERDRDSVRIASKISFFKDPTMVKP